MTEPINTAVVAAPVVTPDPAATPAVVAPVETPTADAGTVLVPAVEAPVVTPGTPDGKADGIKPVPVAPEKYEDFTLPDGIVPNTPVLGKFQEWAKASNLSQEQAQAAINLQGEIMSEMVAAQQKDWTELQTGWVEAAKNDPEYGKEAFNESLVVAKKALDAFGTKELRDMLNTTGSGNHPEVIRFMHRIGKALAEDKIHAGAAPGSSQPKTFADRVYTNTK